MRNWLLPEYIEDILPAQASQIEILRRQILDLFYTHGYELVIPPLLEYVESLLTGTGHDLDLKTFKLVDQLSGRLLGLRADITPQVARIDAHLLNRPGVTRLCYVGSVVHTLPSGLNRTREPLQIGAELYGHSGIESDIEVQRLMLSALRLSGIQKPKVDLGHVGVFGALIKYGNISRELESELFRTLQTKDTATLTELVKGLDSRVKQALLLLPELYGDKNILQRAQQSLPEYPEVTRALIDLNNIAQQLESVAEQCYFDLAELRGYHYHSGAVFACYSEGWANAIALGGRYDEVGKAFGRARPATGFSMDLRELVAFKQMQQPKGILAPYALDDARLQKKINSLRENGERVVMDLPGHAQERAEFNCDRELRLENNNWEIVNIGKG